MTDFKHSYDFHEALRRIGIQNPGSIEIRTPIQLTAEVISFQEGITKPVGVYKYGFQELQSAVSGERGIVEMVCRRPTAVLAVEVGTAQSARLFTSETSISGGALTLPLPESSFRSEDIAGEERSANRITKGSTAVGHGSAPTLTNPSTIGIQWTGIWPLYIPVNHWFVTIGYNVNTAHSVTIWWQEFLSQGPRA